MGSATVTGAMLGSKELEFIPGKVKGGKFHFVIGTAGSCTLVLQTILPALMTAAEPTEIVIEGGTHNTMAPPFDFLEKTFLPLLARMGPKVEMRLHRSGFYPAGGGKISVTITPSASLLPLSLEVRGDITIQRAMAKVVNLARHIAHRELDTLEKELGWQREQLGVEDTKNGVSARNVVMIEIGDDQVTELFTAFGRLGVSAEAVAKEAAEQAKEFPASEAAVGEHLADQLMLPLALAGSGEHVAQKLTEHARTNITVIQQFLDVEFELNEQPRHTRVRIVGRH